MSFLSNALGLNTSALNYNPNSIQLQNPVSTQQAQAGMAQGQAALQGFNPLLAAGLNTGVYGQQQQLANMLMQQAQGKGPNPAQAMLNQNTAQNIQQQASLMGSQRGASANPNLLARQAAQQGSQIQQQAAGQAATLGAQQQLAAQGALASQQAQMAGQNLGLQGTYANAAQNYMNSLLGGVQAQNQAALGQGQIHAGMAAAQGQQTGQLIGGLLGGAGAALGMFGAPAAAATTAGTIGTTAGTAMPTLTMPSNMLGAVAKSDGGPVPGKAQHPGDHPGNDTVPAMLSPGEFVIPRTAMKSEADAIAFIKKHFKGEK